MIEQKKQGIYQKYTKRLMDVILSGVALIALSPVLVIIALLVRLKLGSPVLFKQARPGMNEKIFYLYKFRSMTNATDKDGKLLQDSERLTKFGKFLRKSSIDELPELFNILKGDMSIVGPRPLSIYYLPHYSGAAKQRHDVRPGLTGLAQINGRNNISWDDRFALDAKYVDHLSFTNDVKIMFGTISKVLKAADISVRGTTKVCDFGTYKMIQDEGIPTEKRSDMTYSEIGSYFWLNDEDLNKSAAQIDFLPKVADSTFTFSGRSAIEMVIKDVMKTKKLKKLYAPSYCCVSMLQSFIDHNIKIEFYDVEFKDGEFVYNIDENKNCDMVLFMGYFSVRPDEQVVNKLEKLQLGGAVILEDITHTLFNDKAYADISDYLVVSLRKWFAIPTGGWVGKKNGTLAVKPNIASNHTVLDKISGMKKKYDYIFGKSQDKEEFLRIQSKFDNDLIHVDRMLKLDDVSLSILGNTDIETMSNIRKQNASMLNKCLSDLAGQVLELPNIDLEVQVPLFYPIYLETANRDSLRSYLIKNGIYCPVHWPEVMGASVGVRANELSLICDQRYTADDMKTISDCIHEWYKNIQSDK